MRKHHCGRGTVSCRIQGCRLYRPGLEQCGNITVVEEQYHVEYKAAGSTGLAWSNAETSLWSRNSIMSNTRLPALPAWLGAMRKHHCGRGTVSCRIQGCRLYR